MIKKCLGLIVGLLLLTGCSQFALLSSGAGIAITNNAYVKVYNGIDLATTLTTKKDIKTHAYHYVKATIEKSKEVNEYIFQTVSYPITINKSFDGSVENKIIYAPDYLVNAGGVIAIASEIKKTENTLNQQLEKISERLRQVLEESDKNKQSTDVVAKHVALKRING